MEQNQDIGTLGPVILNRDGKTVQSAGFSGLIHSFYRSVWTGRNLSSLPNGISYIDTIMGVIMMFRRNTLDQINGFDEELCPVLFEDTDTVWRISNLGFRIAVALESNVIHLGGSSFGNDNSRPRNAYVQAYAKNALRSILKNSSFVMIYPEILALSTTQIFFNRLTGLKALIESVRWNARNLDVIKELRRH